MLRFFRSLWTPWVLLAVLGVVWLLDITGAPLPGVARLSATGLLVVGLATWIAAWTARPETSDGGVGVRERRWLVGLFALALVVRLVGITYELIDHPTNDEGVFLAQANRINDGTLFPATFNYGHFLYYAGALALWTEDSLAVVVDPVIETVFGVETADEIDWIMLKIVVALLGALTVPAAFSIARRVVGREGGVVAGVVAALLITFSPLYNDISHRVISDVPSGYFATLCLVFVARLIDRERLGDYLLAGVGAGLAAASKYPGGVVAVAIFAVWVLWRWRERRWSGSLVWAALASILTFFAVMPGLVVNRRAVFAGHETDILLGLRQYARGGWLGVQPDSAVLWYGERLVASFAWPAIALGLAGIFLLGREARRRLFWLLPFPVAYLTLIGAMSMVVARNLQPMLPVLAVVLGVGASGWARMLGRSERLSTRRERGALVAVLLAMLALPVIRTVAWDVSRTRPGTRQLAREWITANVPEGATIVREAYTPRLDEKLYDVRYRRVAAWLPEDVLFGTATDYLLLARNAHRRFLREEAFEEEGRQAIADRYRKIFEELELVGEWRPSMVRAGAHLLLYRAEPRPITYRVRRRFEPADATYVSNEALRRRGADQPFIYTRRWQYAVFKDYFERGSYQVVLDVDQAPREGYLYVTTPDSREIGTWDARMRFEIELPVNEKYLFRLFLAPPTELRGWKLRRIDPADGDDPAASG